MTDHFKTHFIVNPHSANGLTGRVWPEIHKAAREVIGDFEFSMTEGPLHAVELTGSALKNGAEMIVSVGGDGTNNEVVNGFFENRQFVNPEAVFAIICSGTGSDFIRSATIPRNFRESVKLLAGRDYKMIDLGEMTFQDHSGKDAHRYFINIASFGVGGEVDERVNKTSKALGGKISFLYASVRATLAYSNKPVIIKIDDRIEIEKKVFNVAVANGQYHGAGMRAAPNACLDDDLFDIVVMGDLSFLEATRLARLIYEGRHIQMEKVECYRGEVVTATSDERVLLDVDGEQPGTLPATFKILPRILRIKRP
jgi:diacylglycerol kinase (ATP)